MSSTRAKSGRKARKPAPFSRWLLASVAIFAVAALALIGMTFDASHQESAQSGTAPLCPKYDIDPNTGGLRDRGLVPCSNPASRNSRIDQIRGGFTGR